MKKGFALAVVLSLLAVVAIAPLAAAQCNPGTGTNLLFKWDENGFAYESAYDQTTLISSPGSILTTVGVITLWCAPFNGLDPADPLHEYTFMISGLTSLGTVSAPVGIGSTRLTTIYTGGAVAVYDGSPRNAPAATAMPANPPNAMVPANYADGTLILAGVVDTFTTVIVRTSSGSTSGTFRGNYQLTGGSLFNELCQGVGPGLLNGSWSVNGLPTGYSAHPNGKFDAPGCPVPVHSSTWGRIKTLYR